MGVETPDANRAVITGIGIFTGETVGVDAFWQRLLDPDPGPTHRRIDNFDPKEWLDRRLRRHTDPFAQLAVAATKLAVADAELTDTDPDRTGVILGTGNGSAATSI